MLIDVNPIVGNPYKHLLDLPKDEREFELAYVTVNSIDEFKSRTMPGIPMEFHEMMQVVQGEEFHKKKQEVKDRYYRKQYSKPAIAEYVKARDKVMSENLSNLLWLRQCLDKIPEQDLPNRKKVTDAIETFDGLRFL